MVKTNICVLGAGGKPLLQTNKNEFLGLEDILRYDSTNVDIRPLETTDFVQDLSKKKWKLPTDEFDIVIAEHIAEHLPDRIAFINECLRITKPDGLLIIEVPNWCHETAHSNLEHLTTWNRVIFDDGYTCGGRWVKEKVVYRVSFMWRSYYVKSEFIGRQLDRFTNFVSGLRFYLRVK